MKTYYYFFLFSAFGFSSIGADTKLSETKGYDCYDDIDLDVDLNICCEKKITNGIIAVIEAIGRIFGFDSKAFIEAKDILKDPKSRIELILAILVASKYPDEDYFPEGNKLLMKEIGLIGECDNFTLFQRKIAESLSQKIGRTFDVIKKLKTAERTSIISNLLIQEPLIDSHIKSDKENELIISCLEPLLKSCVKP